MAVDDAEAGGEMEVDVDAPAHREPVTQRVIPKEDFGRGTRIDGDYHAEVAAAREAAADLVRKAMAQERAEEDAARLAEPDEPEAEATPVDEDAEPVEAAPAEPEKKPEAEEPQSARVAKVFEKLARQEKAIRERERAVEARLAQVEAFEKAKAAAAAGEPDEALRLLGMDYSSLTATMLKRSPQSAAEKRIAELEAKVAQREQVESTSSQQAAVQSDLNILSRTAQANPDRYAATLAEGGAIELAYDVVKVYYERTGQVMPVEEALDKVETHLIDRAQRIVAAKKQGTKVPTKPGTQPAQPARTGTRSADGPRTLTTDIPTVADRATEGGDLRSPEYYRRQAERALRQMRQG